MESVKKGFMGIVKYLSNWKNLLNHAVVGFFFLIVAIYTPINIFIKLGMIAIVITVNILRMKKDK